MKYIVWIVASVALLLSMPLLMGYWKRYEAWAEEVTTAKGEVEPACYGTNFQTIPCK